MIHINSVSDIKYIFVVEKGLKRVIWMSSLHLMIPRIAVKIAELQTNGGKVNISSEHNVGGKAIH